VTWVRLDDGFADHPKLSQLDDRAFRIHIWALCYCARQLTDGFLAHEVLAGCPLVTRRYTLDRAQVSLVGARLWARRKRGFQIRDYLHFNPSRAQVLEKRKADAERQARARERARALALLRESQRDENERHAPPDPAPKAGKGAAPRGAPQILDDCVGCGERKPLTDHGSGPLLCDECERAAA
jgi:hypothetical protein